MSAESQQEVREAIEFYDSIGRDWSDVVCYLLLRSTGRLERYIHPWTARVERKRDS